MKNCINVCADWLISPALSVPGFKHLQNLAHFLVLAHLRSCCSATQQRLDRFLKLVVRSCSRLAAIAVITRFFRTFPTSVFSNGVHKQGLGKALQEIQLQHQMNFKFPREKKKP